MRPVGGARVVLVSAMASGQGKTSVTAALARHLTRGGARVRIFKVGADFLDPIMLAHACGAPVETLDLWMAGESDCRDRLAHAAAHTDAVLIEGMMGLYDGTPSSADLARTFDVPVVIVIDACAMAQTAGAVAQGLRDYGPVRLAGVIANRIAGAGHAGLVERAMRDITLLATLPSQMQSLPQRHLGLALPQEVPALSTMLNALADSLQLNTAAWERIAPVRFDAVDRVQRVARPPLLGRTIAIARDAAFAFLYPANLGCLEALGARLTWFSPLADEPIPRCADAIYLPGGYPEVHARTLSQAMCWRASIREVHRRAVPIFAECGGMMALADLLQDSAGDHWPMAGVLPGIVRMQSKLAAIGPQAWTTPQGELRGHAFHHSVFDTPLRPIARTRQHPSGTSAEAVYRDGSLTASYFHAYFPSNPAAVAALFSPSIPTESAAAA